MSPSSSTTTGVDLQTIRGLIQAELPELIRIRHDLHAHPELRYEEKRTSQVVQRELAAAGVQHTPGLAGGTGVLGHLDTSDSSSKQPPRKAIGLRADMDALPIVEATGLPYASQNPGVMHACGHDGHTTILIGAARVLAKLAQQTPLPRPVTFVFQPAEEGGAGADRMIQDGCLNGKHTGVAIERMFGLHGWPRLNLNVVATRPGPLLAATDSIELVVRGRGGHAAFPHMTRDPVVAGSAIVTALQTIAARNVDPLDAMVVSITQFHAGSAVNIIAEQATLSGTLRTFSPEVRKLARERIREIAQHTARAFGCEATVELREGYPVTLNDPETVEFFNRVATAVLGEQRVGVMEQPVMGGEDFAFYGQHIPSCFFVLGLLPEGAQDMADLHQDTFNFNDDAIAAGVEMFCNLALGA